MLSSETIAYFQKYFSKFPHITHITVSVGHMRGSGSRMRYRPVANPTWLTDLSLVMR